LKTYLVSLNIITENDVSIDDIRPILKDNEDLHIDVEETDYGLLWSIEPETDETEPLEKHIEAILSIVSKDMIKKIEAVIKEIYLDIAVFQGNDSLMCYLKIPSECIKALHLLDPDIYIDIRTYFVDLFYSEEESKQTK